MHDHKKQRRPRHRPHIQPDDPSPVPMLIVGALVVGLAGGAASVAVEAGSIDPIIETISPMKHGVRDWRSRPPRAGDYWQGCNDARAAGTAPIYDDEPGYRPEMDGDGDGIACEPFR